MSGTISHFPKKIQDFANMFVTMQEKRHKADYDPNAKAKKSQVSTDIDLVEAAIEDFESVSATRSSRLCGVCDFQAAA